MRVALVRSDIGKVYLDDVENSSQRNFSSEPVGQSRYFTVPTDAQIAFMLKGVAFVTKLGTNAQPFDTTVANGTKLNIRASSTAAYTQIVVPSSAAASAATIVNSLNIGFANAGLPFLARATSIFHVAIDSTFGGPGAYIELSAASPSTGALHTVLGMATTAVLGLTVAALKNAVYVGNTAIAGQTGAAATIASVSNGFARLTGVTGMTAADVGRALTISGGAIAANNGTFRITSFISATSVVYYNVDAVAGDNNGAISWTEYANLSVNVSAATINALSSFASLSVAQQTALDNAIANLIAPSLVETGPALLSFVYGKLGKLFSAAFIPGSPQVPTELRVGLPVGAAVAIVANDGVTPFTV